MIKTFTSTPAILSRMGLLNYSQIYSFCANNEVKQENQHKIKSLSHAQNFYRSSIRRINVNDKGRGKFTEHHLLKLTKLTSKQSQLPLLFEGYYNYLGHLTPISSKTVDIMLSKVLSFDQVPFGEVLQIYQNHNYLAYFPSYRVTLQLINSLEKGNEHLNKMIQIFQTSSLIKFNKQVVNKLLKILDNRQLSKSNFSCIVKLLVQRSVLHIIDQQISVGELFSVLCEKIQKKFGQQQTFLLKQNNTVKEFISIVEKKQSEIENFNGKMAVFTLAFNLNEQFYSQITQIADQKQVESILQHLSRYPPNRFHSSIAYILSQQPNEQIKEILSTLKPINSQEKQGEQQEIAEEEAVSQKQQKE